MTADTFSNTLGFIVMGVGNDNNSWGSNATNAVFQVFEDAIANVLTSTVTGGTLDLSGSPPPSAASQVRYAALVFSGTLTGNQIVKVPNLTKFWWVQNASSGAFTLKFQTPSGSASIAIPQIAGWQLVLCDGANNIVVSPFNTAQVPVAPGTVAHYDGITAPSGWFFIYGQAISRPIANGGSVDTYLGVWNAITTTVVGNTNGNTSITGLASDMRALGLNGALVEGTGIPTGTTITFTGATTATVSQAITGSNTGVTFRILPFGQGDASTTFNVRDGRGIGLFGRDDMGGTAAGRITVAGGNYDGTALKSGGGGQNQTLTQAQLPAASVTPTFSGTPVTPTFSGTPVTPTFTGQQQSWTINDAVFERIGGPTQFSSGTGNTCNTTQPTVTITPAGTISQITPAGTISQITPAGTISPVTFGSGNSHPIMPPSGISNMIMKL